MTESIQECLVFIGKSGWICERALLYGVGEEGNDCERRIRGWSVPVEADRVSVFGGDSGGQWKRDFPLFLMLMAGGGRRLRRRPEGPWPAK